MEGTDCVNGDTGVVVTVDASPYSHILAIELDKNGVVCLIGVDGVHLN